MRHEQIVDELRAHGMEDAIKVVLALRERTKQKRGKNAKTWTRMTPATRAEIHRLWHEVGLTQTQIQDRVNYPQGGISRILAGLQ